MKMNEKYQTVILPKRVVTKVVVDVARHNVKHPEKRTNISQWIAKLIEHSQQKSSEPVA
jgi:hypothetical protein